MGANDGKADSDGLVDVACLPFLIASNFCEWASCGTYRSGYSGEPELELEDARRKYDEILQLFSGFIRSLIRKVVSNDVYRKADVWIFTSLVR